MECCCKHIFLCYFDYFIIIFDFYKQALTALLTEENEDVLTNVTGALSEMLRFKHNVDNLRQERGIPHLGK